MEGKYRLCSNCEKKIEEHKMDLHEVYCKKNIKKCVECRQIYDQNYHKEHYEEYHSKSECSYCHLQVLEAHLQDHIKECAPILIYCEYCNLNVPDRMFNCHIEQCESRTITCEVCEKLIMRKELKEHEKKCFESLCMQNEKKNSPPKQREVIQKKEPEEIKQFESGRKKIKIDPGSFIQSRAISNEKHEKVHLEHQEIRRSSRLRKKNEKKNEHENKTENNECSPEQIKMSKNDPE